LGARAYNGWGSAKPPEPKSILKCTFLP